MLQSCTLAQRVTRPARPGAPQKQQQQQQVPEAPSEPAQEGRVYREFQSLGMKVVETDTPLPGPETETDFWEGEKFEVRGLL